MRFSSKKAKKARTPKTSKKWRGALVYLALFGCAPTTVFGAEIVRTVSNDSELRAAIQEFNGNTGDDFKIVLTRNVALTGDLPAVTGNVALTGASSGSLLIEGSGFTIDGASAYRGLFVDAADAGGTISVSSLAFANCVAKGGDGGDGASAGGGGMGAGAAIYAQSGKIVLTDVSAIANTAKGGDGGSVLQDSYSFAGGGGLGGDGGDGALLKYGAANGGGVANDGADANADSKTAVNFVPAGDGGETSPTNPNSFGHYEDKTTPVGGNSEYGGGGGGSTGEGGDGGFGGGGGAGTTIGGSGGFGGGGAGGSSAANAGLGGFGAGNGGYLPGSTGMNFGDMNGGGTGGGGAALGAAIFVGEDADATFVVSDSTNAGIRGNVATAGQGGGGTAQNGQAIGSGLFLLNNLKIKVAKGATYTISDGLGGLGDKTAASVSESGIVKNGEGTLVLNAAEKSSYNGATVVNDGTLEARTAGAISSYSTLDANGGTTVLGANQEVVNLTSSSGGRGAVVDLGGNALTISQGNETGADVAYNGQILSNGAGGTAGTLNKKGTGTLILGGDSRGEFSASGVKIANIFTTNILGGTIRVENDGAFGDGAVVYSRTDPNDQTAALELANGVSVDNDVYFSGNTSALKIGSASDAAGSIATLNGRIARETGKTGLREILVSLNDSSQTLRLTNTGVATTGNDAWTYRSAAANEFDSVRLESGTLELSVSSFENADGTRFWYNSIGGAALTNDGNNRLSFAQNADDLSAAVGFGNGLTLESGLLTIDAAGKNVAYGGTTSGAGGLRIDVGNGATFALTSELGGASTGVFGHAATDLASGTLDVSRSLANRVLLGALSSSASDVALVAGAKELGVGFNGGSATYSGKIVGDGDGAKVFKTGTGAWTADLSDDSKVESVSILGGDFSLGANHYATGASPNSVKFGILVGNGGTFKMSDPNGATIILDDLNASTTGGGIALATGNTLRASSRNASTTIAANLSGAGTLELENVLNSNGSVVDWILNGSNANWAGTVAAKNDGARLVLASKGATSKDSAIALGDGATLTVAETNVLGKLTLGANDFASVASGKTFAVSKFDGGANAFEVGGLGAFVLSGADAAADYTGALTVSGGTFGVVGDNRSTGRAATTLTDGGTLVLDYLNEQSTSEIFDSFWGTNLRIDGAGGLTVANAGAKYVAINEGVEFVGADANALTLNTANSGVLLRSAISGDGALKKTGNGMAILDGTGAFKSATVDAGVLQLGTSSTAPNAQLANAATTVSGGSLIGWTDSLGSLTVRGGTVDILKRGTVALNGAGSVFALDGGTVVVNVADVDHYTNFTTTDGNVLVNRGTFYVSADSNAGLKNGDSLAVVSTENGTLTANPTNVLVYDNVAGSRFVVDHSSFSNGEFRLAMQKVDYAAGAQFTNERSIGAYLNGWLDRGGLDSTMNETIAALENEMLNNPRALNQLTGETRLSAMNAQISSRNLLRQTLTQSVMPRASAASDPTYTGVRGQMSEETTGLAGWSAAFGAGGEAKDRLGTSGFDYKLLGGIIGAEIGSNPTQQLGVYYAYSRTGVDANSTFGNVDVDENQFGSYLRWNDGWGYGLVTGSIGISEYELDRALTFGGRRVANYNGSTDGWSGTIYAERGYAFNLPNSNLQPYGGLQFTHLQMDAFDESGTLQNFAIRAEETEYDSLQGVLGLRWTKSTVLANRLFDFNAYMNWTHEFLDANAEGDATLVGGGQNNGFRVVGNGVGRDWAFVGLGGVWKFNESFEAFGGSDVQMNQYTTYVNGSAGLKVLW